MVPGERDQRMMQRAATLARESLNRCHPRPRVACVLAHDDEIVGEGVTDALPGTPHAEIVAISSAGERARGATAWVTLEPCCHHGTTGPCTDALIDAGVSHVVVAMRDPDPRVAGGGIKALEAAGITTTLLEADASIRQINAGFFSRIERGRPWVRLKLAASMDGRTAMASGESQWITGEAAREDVQLFRARSDVIVSGIGTVLADDPRLTRRIGADTRQPLRVIVDSNLRTPADARLFNEPGDVLIVCRDAAPDHALGARAELLAMPGKTRVDLVGLMQALGSRELNEVHTECGPTLAGQLLEAELVDEIVLYLAPRFIGPSGRALVDVADPGRLAEAYGFSISDSVQVGTDWRFILRN